MASPEVAFAFPSSFEKFSANSRPKQLRKEHNISVAATTAVCAATAAAAAAAGAPFPDFEIDWTPSYPSAADVGSVPAGEDLPVIDLGGLRSTDPAERAKIVREIGSATESWGFFLVVNHGVSETLMARLQEQARGFFQLPVESKKRVEIFGRNPRCMGYKGTFSGDPRYKKIPIKEALADFRSNHESIDELMTKIWPAGNAPFGQALKEHGDAVNALGLQLLELMAESLKLDRSFFSKHFQPGRDGIGTWRLHHFPRYAAPTSVWRTVPHSDPSVLTILRQDVGGLQIKKPGGNLWIDVKPLPGSYVVNVGDVLEAWSNGRFPSVEHRVALSESSQRFSSVNFLDAGPFLWVEAPPELIDEDHPSLFKPFVANSFRENFDRIKPLGDIRKGKALDYVRRKPLYS